MGAKMIKAAVLHGAGDLRVEGVPMPTISKSEEVLVRMKAAGVCGSDVHFYEHGRIGSFVVRKPMILGHECAGVVEAVGEEVEGLRPGDHVALEPGIPCGSCVPCRRGRYNLCREVRFMAAPPVDGAFVEYMVHPASFMYKLPNAMTLEEGAMIEPLSVGMHAVIMGGMLPGDAIAILGSGPIGLMTLQAARAAGAGRAIMTDLYASRLDLAKQLGASEVVHAGETEVGDRVKELTGGEGVDVVFEAVGVGATIHQAMDMVKPGGTIALIGLGAQGPVPMDTSEFVFKEIKIQAIHRYANVYDRAIALVERGGIDLKSMITGRYPLDRVVEALELPERRPDRTIKSIISLDGE